MELARCANDAVASGHGPCSFVSRFKSKRSMIGYSYLFGEILSACLRVVVDEADTAAHLSEPVSISTQRFGHSRSRQDEAQG